MDLNQKLYPLEKWLPVPVFAAGRVPIQRREALEEVEAVHWGLGADAAASGGAPGTVRHQLPLHQSEEG